MACIDGGVDVEVSLAAVKPLPSSSFLCDTDSVDIIENDMCSIVMGCVKKLCGFNVELLSIYF